jgi:hypothetical protein
MRLRSSALQNERPIASVPVSVIGEGPRIIYIEEVLNDAPAPVRRRLAGITELFGISAFCRRRVWCHRRPGR